MRQLPAQAGLLRSINRSAIIDFVRREQRTSPSQVSASLGISLPTVTRVLEGLREEGFVEYDGYEDSSGGRPAARIRFCGEAHAVIAVHTSLGVFYGAVCDLSGRIITELEIAQSDDGEANVAKLIGLIRTLRDAPRPGIKSLRGIGVGVPGMVRQPEGRVVLTWAGLGWSDLGLLDRLKQAFDEPVYLENNKNLAAVGEWAFGAGQGVDDLVNLSIGPGASAGIMIGGRVFRGGGEAAGEVKWFLDDPRLGGHTLPLLGDRNSLRFDQGIPAQAVAALEAAGEQYRAGKLPLELFELGKPAASGLEIVHQLLDYTTMAATSVAGLLNPTRIILTGGIARGGQFLVDVLRLRLSGDVYDVPDLVVSTLGHRAVIMGAVMIVLDGTILNPHVSKV
jgi:predicted NBD/HSP70 family sugar kinase